MVRITTLSARLTSVDPLSRLEMSNTHDAAGKSSGVAVAMV